MIVIYRNNKAIIEAPEWLAVRSGDIGHEVSAEMALAKTEQGEKVSNFKTFSRNDRVMGDRAYCSKQGIEYLLGRGSGFLLRFGTKRFHVYNKAGRQVPVLGYFKGLQPGGSGEMTLYYEYEGEYKPLRFACCGKAKKRGKKVLKPC